MYGIWYMQWYNWDVICQKYTIICGSNKSDWIHWHMRPNITSTNPDMILIRSCKGNSPCPSFTFQWFVQGILKEMSPAVIGCIWKFELLKVRKCEAPKGLKVWSSKVPGPGARGPTGGPSYGLHLESPYTWRVFFKLSSFETPGPGARGPTGGPSYGLPLESLYTWRVLFKLSSFQAFCQSFKVCTSAQTVICSNCFFRTVPTSFSKARTYKRSRTVIFLALYDIILCTHIYS